MWRLAWFYYIFLFAEYMLCSTLHCRTTKFDLHVMQLVNRFKSGTTPLHDQTVTNCLGRKAEYKMARGLETPTNWEALGGKQRAPEGGPMRCFIFLQKKSFERNIRKSLVFPFFDLKIMILHRGRGRGRGYLFVGKRGKMGGTPSSQCLKANKYPGLELGQPFTTHTIFVKKMALICQISTTSFGREPKYSKGFLNLKNKFISDV